VLVFQSSSDPRYETTMDTSSPHDRPFAPCVAATAPTIPQAVGSTSRSAPGH